MSSEESSNLTPKKKPSKESQRQRQEELLLKKELKQREKEEKKLLREQKKAEALLKKQSKQIERKQPKSEREIVEQYANIIIAKQQTRGTVNLKHHGNLAARTPSKELWQDTDFYFSIVFQSRAQKISFLNQFEDMFDFELDDHIGQNIQILNGLRLADKMGIKLNKEFAEPYQSGNIELKNIVLDDQKG